jgi:hypothetical protein
MKCTKYIFTGALFTVAFSSSWAADQIQIASEDFTNAPKAVQDGVAKEYPKSRVTDCDRDKENGLVRYRVALTDQNGVKHKVLLSEDGKVIEDKAKDEVK